nr:callose synthase 10 [Tanacetum cinerariifolium]
MREVLLSSEIHSYAGSMGVHPYVTLGVPSINEILNAAKKISTPVITTKLRSSDNLSYAKLVKVQMERTYLGHARTILFMFVDNYREVAMKMRKLVEEFRANHGLRPPTILGVKEHVFTGSGSSLAWFMSN